MKTEKCDCCERGEKYFEGCSIVECPKRKPITAQLTGEKPGCVSYFAKCRRCGLSMADGETECVFCGAIH